MNKNTRTFYLLAIAVILLSAIASVKGIISDDGPGSYTYHSIRGEKVEIYGEGIYRHMSADVAIQGIAQDYITLFAGIPLLIIGLLLLKKKSLKGRFLLTGTTFYFFVTYWFYTAMAMYNELYLLYVALMGFSFFLLISLLLSFNLKQLPQRFKSRRIINTTGGFLIFNSIAVAMMWLGVVAPPLIEGSIYPPTLQHYTTLIVQGFDLGLLLPMAFLSGILLLKKKPLGFIAGPSYIIFLAILMTALSAKIIAMGLHGVNIIPAVFIIPAINLTAVSCAVWVLMQLE